MPWPLKLCLRLKSCWKRWITTLPILSSPWTHWSLWSLILFSCNLLFLSLITLCKYLGLESPSSNHLILAFCFKIEFCIPNHQIYFAWPLLRASLDWSLLVKVSCSSRSCILVSHSFTWSKSFPTLSLDHWLNFLLSSFSFCWSLQVMWVDHTCSTKFMKDGWSTKNKQYLIPLWWSFQLLTRSGLWSDPVPGRCLTTLLE